MKTTYDFVKTYLQARFADDERGASLVEYALLVALIAVACIAAIGVLSGGIISRFTETGNQLGGGG
jgi:pilus assembly protein Flp/PilA